jgi:hypothetical protein
VGWWESERERRGRVERKMRFSLIGRLLLLLRDFPSGRHLSMCW